MSDSGSSGGGGCSCLSVIMTFAAILGLSALYFWSDGMAPQDAVQVRFGYDAVGTLGLFCGLPLAVVGLVLASCPRGWS